MATSEIQLKAVARAAFAITLNNLAAANGRQSAMIANAGSRPAAIVSVAVKSGIAPAPGGTYDVYLLRSDGVTADDNAGAGDADLTVENAPLLGSIVVTADAGKTFRKLFDTSNLGPLGATWGIAVVNRTSADANAAGHSAGYSYLVPEAQ